MVAAYLVACPKCGEPPEPIVSRAETMGFRLFDTEEALPMPKAQAVSLPVPPPPTARS
jgi:hypothetical protein